jgi:hypothetical protein
MKVGNKRHHTAKVLVKNPITISPIGFLKLHVSSFYRELDLISGVAIQADIQPVDIEQDSYSRHIVPFLFEYG